jgi:hypothetical protein
LFAKCIVRGLEYSWGGISAPTVAIDTDGDHLAHGPEIARFVISGSGTFEFSSAEQAVQYNTVFNQSDQAFSRDSMAVTDFRSSYDKYGTGVSSAYWKLKNNPLYGSNIHFFDDKQPIILRNLNGGTDFSNVITGTESFITTDPGGYASTDYVTPGNESSWYYMAMIGNAEAWLYNSQANIDDDRLVRVVELDNLGSTAVGDTLSVTSGTANGANATIFKIDGSNVHVLGRSNATLDIGVTSGLVDTTTGGVGVGNITQITTDTSVKDYYTSLNALTETDLGMSSTNTLTDPDMAFYGNPPPRSAWTFMARNVTNTVADSDGDSGPALGNADIRMDVVWRERNL